MPSPKVLPISTPRERFAATEPGQPSIVIQHQRGPTGSRGDVLYVHGATFGADLSVFFSFDGQSWADSLVHAGFSVWGFDFAGFGSSDRQPAHLTAPAGAMEAALRELRRVVVAIRARNGDRPIVLIAHSRGAAVAARYAGKHPDDVLALVLFAPIVTRRPAAPPMAAPTIPRAEYPLSVWAQYRRFVEDVPRGEPQVLDEGHMQAWAAAYLTTDPQDAQRTPASVLVPYGPVADILAMWRGEWLYDPSRISAPTLLVRGEWDSLCNDSDAATLMAALRTPLRRDIKVPRATHLMHLEGQRAKLHAEVNTFLSEVLQ